MGFVELDISMKHGLPLVKFELNEGVDGDGFVMERSVKLLGFVRAQRVDIGLVGDRFFVKVTSSD